MPTFHFQPTTTSTPEQFIAGFTDFGPDRGELFPNSTDDYREVHRQVPARPMSPRAREASGSGCTTGPTPRRVVLTTTDSNAWGGKSGHTHTLTSQPQGRPKWT
ncbi:MAG TPA: hypothetical protein VH476_08155 [Solirubrobacterales bacterium]